MAYPIIWQQGYSCYEVSVAGVNLPSLWPLPWRKYQVALRRAPRSLKVALIPILFWWPSSSEDISSLETVKYGSKWRTPNENKWAVYSELAIARIGHYYLHLTDSEAGRGVGKLYKENKEGHRYALVRDCWHRQAGANYIEAEHLMWLARMQYLTFSGRSWVRSRGKTIVKLAVLTEPWPFRADCFRGCGSQFYRHVWSGHCPFAYSISHKTNWIIICQK